VYRHSSAKHVEVQGRVRDNMLEVTVRDDGIGFDVAQALRMDSRKLSFGLISMQERVSALGGTLTLRSQSGRGTRVLISLPLKRMEGAVRS
jgi:signal transduction histidine kinase